MLINKAWSWRSDHYVSNWVEFLISLFKNKCLCANSFARRLVVIVKSASYCVLVFDQIQKEDDKNSRLVDNQWFI